VSMRESNWPMAVVNPMSSLSLPEITAGPMMFTLFGVCS
jgi:hypothetical protein